MSDIEFITIEVEAPIQTIEVQVPSVGTQAALDAAERAEAAAAAAAAAAASLVPFEIRKYTPIMHRGGALIAPENTMQAFCAAVALGATHLEMDIQMTYDRVAVAHHDERVERTTQGTGRVSEWTLERLQMLNAASPLAGLTPDEDGEFGSAVPTFATQYPYDEYLNPTCRIPTFDEVMAWSRNRVEKFFVELKMFADWTQDEVNALCDTVTGYELQNVVVFQCTQLQPLHWVRARSPDIGILFDRVNSLDDIDTFAALGGQRYLLYGDTQLIADPSLVTAGRALGADIVAATISSSEGIYVKDLLDIGVGLQMTDAWIGGLR